MAGLSLVLESNKTAPKNQTQILSKTQIIKIKDSTTTTSSSSSSSSTFLEYCFLCRRRLLPGNDIYMYKGDRGFCSVECRFRQMLMDAEEDDTITKNSSSSWRRRKGGGGRGRVGGFAGGGDGG